MLCLAERGLWRHAEPSDAMLRAAALKALRALHSAGLGHPTALATSAWAALFDGAAPLLTAVTRAEPVAVAAALIPGLRKAFAALLWQQPKQLAFTSNDKRGFLAAAKAFSSCGRMRHKWLQCFLAEFCSKFCPESFPELPGATPRRRLRAFGGDRVKVWEHTVDPVYIRMLRSSCITHIYLRCAICCIFIDASRTSSII